MCYHKVFGIVKLKQMEVLIEVIILTVFVNQNVWQLIAKKQLILVIQVSV